MTSFNHNYFLKALSLHRATLGVRTSTYILDRDTDISFIAGSRKMWRCALCVTKWGPRNLLTEINGSTPFHHNFQLPGLASSNSACWVRSHQLPSPNSNFSTHTVQDFLGISECGFQRLLVWQWGTQLGKAAKRWSWSVGGEETLPHWAGWSLSYRIKAIEATYLTPGWAQ